MIYRIVSDISAKPNGKASFCVKVVNGTILSYRGTFRTNKKDTAQMELHASYIGLCLVHDILKRGDKVIVHSDIDHFGILMRKEPQDNLYSLISYLKRSGIEVEVRGIGDVRSLYDQCHFSSRERNKLC